MQNAVTHVFILYTHHHERSGARWGVSPQFALDESSFHAVTSMRGLENLGGEEEMNTQQYCCRHLTEGAYRIKSQKKKHTAPTSTFEIDEVHEGKKDLPFA